MSDIGCQTTYSPARAVPCLNGNRNGLDSMQRGSGAHARNGRDPAVDQEVCPDDVRRVVRREINRQLRDFRRIGHPLAGIVGCKDALDSVALLFACEATEHRRVRRACWARCFVVSGGHEEKIDTIEALTAHSAGVDTATVGVLTLRPSAA